MEDGHGMSLFFCLPRPKCGMSLGHVCESGLIMDLQGVSASY